MSRLAMWGMMCMFAVALTGCGLLQGGDGGGSLSVRSRDDQGVVLKGGFQSGYYRFDGDNAATIILFDGPADNPVQAVTMRLMWRPRAGRTPIEPTATNVTMHYVIFTPGESAEVGIYSGAGYLYPRSKLGSSSLRASLWDASLRLQDASDHFHYLLGQAVIQGDFTVRRDDAAMERLRHRVNLMIRQRLGYPRLVDAQSAAPDGLALRQPLEASRIAAP